MSVLLLIIAIGSLVTSLWTVFTGFAMLSTSGTQAQNFHLSDVRRTIRSTIWVPFIMFRKTVPRNVKTVDRYPANYIGTLFTTIAGLVISGFTAWWISKDLPSFVGDKLLCVWMAAHIIDNVGKSLFHIKAIKLNFEGIQPGCDLSLVRVRSQSNQS